MGFLAGVHQRGTWRGPYSLKDPALAELYGYGARTIAGPVVTELTAFMCAAFWNGVDQISSDTAKQPLNLLKRLQGGGSEPYLDSRTYRLLKFRPNPETGSMMFRKTLIAHALVYGNGYAEIVRDPIGRPSALWTLHPNRVQPFYEEQRTTAGVVRKPLKYRIEGEVVIDPSDIIHLAGLSDDAVVGYNLVGIAREALGMALASQQFLSAFFGNGTRFGGVLSSDQEIDADQEKEIRKRIEKIHAKADKAFRLLILGAGFQFKESGVKPNDAQMTQIRDQQVTEIARYLNMPLHKLKLAMPGAVSYASVEMADLDYYKGPILTWTTALEEELNAKLISPLEWGRQYFKHNSNAFLRGDIKSRYDALGIAHDKGVINANEWRELEDMNPQEGEQGNLYFIQSGFIPKNKSEELVQSQIEKNNQPPPAPSSPSGGNDPGSREALEQIAARLEELVGEARAAYQAEVEKRVAAEAKSETTAAELEARKKSESEALAKLTTLEVLAAERGKELEAQIARASAAEEARDKAQADEKTARDAERQTMRERDEALAEKSRHESSAAEARRLAEAAAAETVRAKGEADEARAACAAREMDLSAAVTRRDSAVSDVERLTRELEEAVSAGEAVDELRSRIEELTRDVSAAQSAVQESAAALESAAVARAEAERLAREAVSTAEVAAAGRTEAEQALASATERAAGSEAALDELRQQHVSVVQAQRKHLEAVIASHHALAADVASRLQEREADRARAHQQSPEKMRTWIETFYGKFHDQFVEAILPAVRVHLAWKQSTDNPRDVAVAMATRHCEESKAQLRAFLNATPDDFHVAVDHLLKRWEKDRPNAIADALLADEIAHLRELERSS